MVEGKTTGKEDEAKVEIKTDEQIQEERFTRLENSVRVLNDAVEKLIKVQTVKPPQPVAATPPGSKASPEAIATFLKMGLGGEESSLDKLHRQLGEMVLPRLLGRLLPSRKEIRKHVR